MNPVRCPWASTPAEIAYHDQEWGRPLHDDRAFLRVQEEFGSFDAYLWSWVDGVPIVNRPRSMADLHDQTPLSQALSRDLKRRGFKYVGPVIVYAYLQSAGLINDHMAWCPWHDGPPR